MLLTTPAWTMYTLIPVGTFIISWLILYLVRFRYPPLVRKMRDMRWEIRAGVAPRWILVGKLRPRGELLADVYNHAMYPVTGDSRYILCPRPCPIATIPYSLLKKAYRERPTCQELRVDLERDCFLPCSDISPGNS